MFSDVGVSTSPPPHPTELGRPVPTRDVERDGSGPCVRTWPIPYLPRVHGVHAAQPALCNGACAQDGLTGVVSGGCRRVAAGCISSRCRRSGAPALRDGGARLGNRLPVRFPAFGGGTHHAAFIRRRGLVQRFLVLRTNGILEARMAGIVRVPSDLEVGYGKEPKTELDFSDSRGFERRAREWNSYIWESSPGRCNDPAPRRHGEGRDCFCCCNLLDAGGSSALTVPPRGGLALLSVAAPQLAASHPALHCLIVASGRVGAAARGAGSGRKRLANWVRAADCAHNVKYIP
eukprot:gene10049-biopygen8485